MPMQHDDTYLGMIMSRLSTWFVFALAAAVDPGHAHRPVGHRLVRSDAHLVLFAQLLHVITALPAWNLDALVVDALVILVRAVLVLKALLV